MKPPRSPAICSSDNLCWIYDNNRITIEGNTKLAFRDDVGRGSWLWVECIPCWRCEHLDILDRAFNYPREPPNRPTLLIVDSHIAYGAPTKTVHGRGAWRAAW